MLGPGEDAPAGEPTVSPLPDSRHALAEAQEQGARGRQRLCSWSKDLSAREQHRRESNVALSPMSSPLLPLPSKADFASLGGPSCPLPTTSLDEAHVEETGIPCQAAEVPSHAQEAPTGLSASPSQKHFHSHGGGGKVSVQTPASCGAFVSGFKLRVY